MNLYNNISIPDIGAGTYPYKEDLKTTIPQMVNAGYRLFDTSDNYHNETFLGTGLAGIETEILDEIIIITKYSNPLQDVQKSFDSSSYKIFSHTQSPSRKANIYLMHWPYPHLWERRWKELENLYMNGCCKAIGVCNFTIEHLERLLSFCRIKPMINQFECHPMFQQREIIDYCKKEGIQVISYSPLARMREELSENSVLSDIARKHNKSVGQIVLKWNTMEGRIPIPASRIEAHMMENYDIFNFELEKAELEEINALEKGMRIRFDPNNRFALPYRMGFYAFDKLLSVFTSV